MKHNYEIKLMTGNEACVEGAIAAGVRFYASYPITPATEITELFAKRLPQVGGVFLQMEDEIASLGAVMGASLAGARAMTATSGPGFSLMQENLSCAFIMEIPLLVINVQRVGPGTGSILPAQMDTMQARWGTHGGLPGITLAASSVRECFDLTVMGVNLAESYRIPVVLLTDAGIAHLSENVVLPETQSLQLTERCRPTCSPESYLSYDADEADVPPMASFGEGYRCHISCSIHGRDGVAAMSDPAIIEAQIRHFERKVLDHRDEITFVERSFLDDADIVLFAYGSVGRAARAAVLKARQSGVKLGLLRPITLWPFPDHEVSRLAEHVDKIIVAEMNLGQMVGEVERAVAGKAKVELITGVNGRPITPSQILEKIDRKD